jgi:peptidoglycan/xylan/chitin deacetylase (PgdA/CDA1 family)
MLTKSVRARVKQVIQNALQRGSAGRVVWRGPAERRRVALTFDDGPHAMTPRYLETLARLDVPATFFIMGVYVERDPSVVAEYLRGGHQVGGHGYYHKRFTRTRPDELVDHLRRTSRALGPVPHGHWVRPPHGSLGPVDLATMLATGYTVAMWSHDSRDHDRAAPEVIAERCAPSRLRPGDVVLFHEGQEETLAALPRIVGALHDAGYELVTMADLFAR